MAPARVPSFFFPIAGAVSQLGDPAFIGILLRSFAWSLAGFTALQMVAVWAVHNFLGLHGWLAWTIDLLGSVGASLLGFWLFLPVAAGIGTLYLDKIASAVEQRFYPWLARPRGASFLEQAWDGIAVASKVLALNVVALILVLLFPGVGLMLGWMISAYAIGRGLFVAVAMRRMPRDMAESLYRLRRGAVLAQGAVLALAAYVPVLNLFIPVIGIAAMVHVLDLALEFNPIARPT